MQAARGTSVDRSSARPGRPGRLLVVFAAVALGAYALDQVTKVLAVSRLKGEPDVQVVGDLLRLHYTTNPGAAFSTGTGLTPLISVVAVVATVVVLVLSRRIGSRAWAVAMGLLLAGITGNLTDRLLREPGPLRGHVIDFLRLPSWPVFNIADVCINVAAGLIVLQAIRGVRLDGSRTHDATDESDEAGESDESDETDETVEERTE